VVTVTAEKELKLTKLVQFLSRRLLKIFFINSTTGRMPVLLDYVL